METFGSIQMQREKKKLSANRKGKKNAENCAESATLNDTDLAQIEFVPVLNTDMHQDLHLHNNEKKPSTRNKCSMQPNNPELAWKT